MQRAVKLHSPRLYKSHEIANKSARLFCKLVRLKLLIEDCVCALLLQNDRARSESLHDDDVNLIRSGIMQSNQCGNRILLILMEASGCTQALRGTKKKLAKKLHSSLLRRPFEGKATALVPFALLLCKHLSSVGCCKCANLL